MTNNRESPSDVTASRIKDLRMRRGWTAAQLADECAKHGAPELTAQAIANIESGRRDKTTGRRRRHVTVEELLAFAVALDVAPVHLLVPLDDTPYEVVPGTVTERSGDAREWVRGLAPLSGTDLRTFWSEVPEHEFGKTEPTQERERWEKALIGYLSRAVGRLYKREDGSMIFEWTIREGEDNGAS